MSMIETLLQNRTVQVLIESFPRILLPGLAVDRKSVV